MTLAIFNPEHDLCLANGRAHYLPPQSAVAFARRSASLMQILYPDALCTSLYDLPSLNSQLSTIIPWGWNLVLKQDLLDRGVPAALLPADGQLDTWRRLQHRATILPLQPDCHPIQTIDEAEAILLRHPQSVFKAPWSGAGRGLRWVAGSLTPHDVAWIEKVIREQNTVSSDVRCVIHQPRYDITDDFALLYHIETHSLRFVGYSLFKTASGVYRGNILLPDDEIQCRVGIDTKQQDVIEKWIKENLVGHYQGPLGIDLFRTVDGDIHVSELNLRHTMGHVAHAYLQQHPDVVGSLFNPMELG